MKALITGADGFIGSHLAEALLEEGHEVRCLAMYNSFGHNGWLDDIRTSGPAKPEIIRGDIRDTAMTETLIEDVDTVFHLAALIAIPYSYSAAESYVDTNVKGTLNVLNGCRRHKTKRVLITSTSEVYGTAKYVPIDEVHPRQAQSPYSASKIAADALSDSFFRSFGLPVTVVRPFNTFGPRQSARAVIPTIINQLLSGKKTLSLGSLHPTRDLVYVRDTAKGFLKIAETQSLIGEEVNIATGTEISIGDLAGMIMKLTGINAGIQTENERVRPEKSEVQRLLGSSAKLERHTGWKPETGLEAGLEETIMWFRNFVPGRFMSGGNYEI